MVCIIICAYYIHYTCMIIQFIDLTDNTKISGDRDKSLSTDVSASGANSKLTDTSYCCKRYNSQNIRIAVVRRRSVVSTSERRINIIICTMYILHSVISFVVLLLQRVNILFRTLYHIYTRTAIGISVS